MCTFIISPRVSERGFTPKQRKKVISTKVNVPIFANSQNLIWITNAKHSLLFIFFIQNKFVYNKLMSYEDIQ